MIGAKVMIGDEAFTRRSGDGEFVLLIKETQDRLLLWVEKGKSNCGKTVYRSRVPSLAHTRTRVLGPPQSHTAGTLRIK